MTSTDQQPFVLLMTSIAELYGKKLSKPLLDIYWRCLEPYSLALIRTALKAHILHPDGGQFMPKPADVLRIIHGNSETQALQAWGKVLQAIRMVGSYDSVVFDDPVIHAAIMELGGWVELCHSDTKSLVFIGKQFEKIYSGYLHRKPSHYPKQLSGQIKQQVAHSGYFPKTLRLLGDKVKALEVWQSGCDPMEWTRHYAGIRMDISQLKALACEPKSNAQISDSKTAPSFYTGDNHRED